MKRFSALSLLVAFLLSALGGPAFAACTNPFAAKDGGGSTVNLSVVQGADGNCQSNIAPNVWYPGTSNNGLLTTLLTLESTELNSLANGAVIVSSVGGSSGLFTNSNTGQAKAAELFFTAGTAGASCQTGATLVGWFLQSPDGTTFEATTSAPARAPDFIFSLPATTLNATFKAQGQVQVPALNFKVLVQNNCGTSGTLAASANTLKLAPLALQN